MALNLTVTKAFPTDSSVGMHLNLTDDDRADLGAGAQTVIDKDYMASFSGDEPTLEIKTEIGETMQRDIDSYKTRRTKFTDAAYDTARTQIAAGLTVMLLFVLMLSNVSHAALTITSSEVTGWTAVAEGAHSVTTDNIIDISSNYSTAIQIQAFLNLDATAHEGTLFKIEVSQKSTGNEDWSDYFSFTALSGTCYMQDITNNPLAAASTSLTVGDTEGLYETANTVNPQYGRWIAIEDTAAIANCELVWQTAHVADTSVTFLDGTTTEHANTANISDIAMSRTIVVPMGLGSRVRVIVNNSYDADATACSLNYKVNKTVCTSVN